MSQFDFGTIDPDAKNGTDLASDLGNWRDALNTLHRGASRPSYAQEGTLWVQEVSGTVWRLRLYDGTQDIVFASINPSTGALTLADGTVVTSSIENGAITNAKIEDETIAGGKLQAGAVFGTRIAEGAVSGTRIAVGAVTETRLADGAVSFVKLAAAALASQAQAEAGASNSTLMTPFRVAQAIAALGGGSGVTHQVFTSSGTWNRPSGCTDILLFLAGGGGGGGGAAAFDASAIILGGGGGAGASGWKFIDVTSLASASVTIGAAGSGGPATGGATRDGTAGGSSSFGTEMTCPGGSGGEGESIAFNRRGQRGGDGGAAPSSGDIRIAGQNGFISDIAEADANGYLQAGAGGGAFFGAGGAGGQIARNATASAAGQDGTAPGSGGGGAISKDTNSSTGAAGGDGGPGIAFVLEFYG